MRVNVLTVPGAGHKQLALGPKYRSLAYVIAAKANDATGRVMLNGTEILPDKWLHTELQPYDEIWLMMGEHKEPVRKLRVMLGFLK